MIRIGTIRIQGKARLASQDNAHIMSDIIHCIMAGSREGTGKGMDLG